MEIKLEKHSEDSRFCTVSLGDYVKLNFLTCVADVDFEHKPSGDFIYIKEPYITNENVKFLLLCAYKQLVEFDKDKALEEVKNALEEYCIIANMVNDAYKKEEEK